MKLCGLILVCLLLAACEYPIGWSGFPPDGTDGVAGTANTSYAYVGKDVFTSLPAKIGNQLYSFDEFSEYLKKTIENYIGSGSNYYTACQKTFDELRGAAQPLSETNDTERGLRRYVKARSNVSGDTLDKLVSVVNTYGASIFYYKTLTADPNYVHLVLLTRDSKG